LTLGSLILVGGSLGDIYGERRVFSVGIAAFGVLSFVCALAPTVGVLIAARAVQGASAALITPSSLAIIVAAFNAKERGAAIGAWTAWGGIASIIGPLAGGVVVGQLTGGWVFALYIPPVAGTLGLVRAAVPASARVAGRHIDVVGACLGAAALAGVVFALIEQPRYGWASAAILGPLVGGLACAVAFVAYERRIPQPMVK